MSSPKPAAATPVEVLRHATAFLSSALSNADLRRRALSSARRRLPLSSDSAVLRSLNAASQALDCDLPNPSPYAERLLLTLPRAASSPLSSLLHALLFCLRHRDSDAASALLDVFLLDPAAARHDIAPQLFEALFAPRLVPLFQWLAARRAGILSPDRSGTAGVVSAIWDNVDEYSSVSMEAAAGMSRLSDVSAGQAEELRELEEGYEEVLDENTRSYAGYFKALLANPGSGTAAGGPAPPELVLARGYRRGGGGGGIGSSRTEETAAEGQIGMTNGRNNPIWAGADLSAEWSVDSCDSRRSRRGESGSSASPPIYPQRITLDLLAPMKSSQMKEDEAASNSLFRPDGSLDKPSEDSSFDSNAEETDTGMEFRFLDSVQPYKQDQQSLNDAACSSGSRMVGAAPLDLTLHHSGKQKPPKDFVCPITGQVFDDPVTLETGQTYERKAIQEWLDRGNSTCPITRQSLQSTQLPRTNYVLKRLIAGWKENHSFSTSSASPSPPSVDHHREKNTPVKKSSTRPSSSPTSVITQANGDSTLTTLRLAVSQLCTSDVLSESEQAVLQIEQLWRETNMEDEVTRILSTPQVVNGFVEILFNSIEPKVLKGTIFLLSELASREKCVIQTLTAVDSDVDCIVALFKKGLAEAVVLVYQLGTSCDKLIELDMTDALITTIKGNEGDSCCGMFLNPQTAAVLLLAEILNGEHSNSASAVAQSLISERVVESIVSRTQSDLVEEKISAVGILLRCIEEDGRCRSLIADKAELGPLLDSFNLLNDGEQFQMISILFELAKQNRRCFNDQLLQNIKEKGVLSIMHLLLNYLQSALHDQTPIVAGLLLQLDLLSEPQKMSIYREEAIDALIACLKNADFPSSQVGAADVILALQGRFSLSGKPLGRAILLKRAGMNKSYRAIMRAEKTGHPMGNFEINGDEEKAADEWEKKMAFALATHEFGLLFEALAEGLDNGQTELFTSCHVSATWLVYLLSFLPDTGLKGAARVCLLEKFISILKSAEDIDDKALAMLAMKSLMSDPEGLKYLLLHMKDIWKSLRELKKYSALAYDVLRLLSEGKETSRDFYKHKELSEFDCSTHGEVSSVICFEDRIYSGHGDGTLKVWINKGNLICQVNEIQEHTKSISSLEVSSSEEKLYSGSIDKTIRVWSAVERELQCLEVVDMKDQVHNLAVFGSIICYTPQSYGVKVISLNGAAETLNSSKQIRTLSLVQGKLYCGCNDNSIQELDLPTCTVSTIQSSAKKFLGKANPVYAIQVHNGLLYSVNTSLDGSAIKIWNTSNFNLVGSFQSSMDVRCMAVTSDLIYLGCKTGCVEIWCREQLSRVETLHTAGGGRVQCMAVDSDGEILVVGTSDGRIQAWGLC